LFLVFVISSCSTSRKDGDWDDNIHLSTQVAEFGAEADSITVTTEGTWWWVTGISVNGVGYYPSPDIDLETDSYSIEEDCFVVERRDNKTLFIKVNENPLNVQRIIRVELEAGDYFDGVTITQAAQ
jgi:hypothetical protein